VTTRFGRRRFFRLAGGALAGAALGQGCDLFAGTDNDLRPFFAESFTRADSELGPDWHVARSAGIWRQHAGEARARVGPAKPLSVIEGPPQTEYLSEPILVKDFVAEDVAVTADIEVVGGVEAGILARWSFAEAYALLLTRSEALLCRYSQTDRRVLDRGPLPATAGPFRLRLRIGGGSVRGNVGAGTRATGLTASDPEPLAPGWVGLVANPIDPELAGRVRVLSFRAVTSGSPQPGPGRMAYRFTGGVVPDGHAFRARVTARTVVPQAISFEYSRQPDVSEAQSVGPFPPRGRLGAVQAWLEGLEADTVYYWRPVTEGGDLGPPARFRTPPRTGSAVRFAFGSCTSGRMGAYPSFATAARLEPAFFVHAGDFGYPDLTAHLNTLEHYQARWIRLVRSSEMEELLASTPLMFWQDDHDYQANNGWRGEIKPYAVEAFDELHANPTSTYFDVRWGDVHVWCLDTRRYADRPNAFDDSRKTKLGFAQKSWLKEGMTASDAPVQVVASSMPFRNKVDADPGWHNRYTTERDELLGFFAELDRAVFILSGDAHGHRLIHHFEFGDLFEITSSGTDFPFKNWAQGNHDPEHTLIEERDRTGFALIELDPEGVRRRLTVRVVSSDDGATIFEKSIRVG